MSQEHLDGLHVYEFHDVEFEEAMRLQNPQLQLIRKLGVAQMIEQEAGIGIPPMVFEDDPTQPSKVDWSRTLNMGMPEGEGYMYGRKWVIISMPSPTDKGVFDTTLRINASRITNHRLEDRIPYGYFVDKQSVLIEFDQDNHLKVVGDKTTFEGNLAAINDELLARVQTGIKEAFTNPKSGREPVLRVHNFFT